MNRLTLSVCMLLPFLNVHADDWAEWRGSKRDGISRETGLLKTWPEGGPKVAWEADTVGVGYASVSVKAGRIITQGDLEGRDDLIESFIF